MELERKPIRTRSFSPLNTNEVPGVYGHTMCIKHETNTVYVYGGWTNSRTDRLMSCDLNQLSSSNEGVQWDIIQQEDGHKPGLIAFASLTEARGNLILFAGYAVEGWTNHLWLFNLETKRWRKIEYKQDAPVAPVRAACSAILINDKTEMIIHGGFNGTEALSDTWKYSFITNSWGRLASSYRPTTSHSCVVNFNETKLYKFGGWDKQVYYNVIEEYDIASNKWSILHDQVHNPPENVPVGRWAHSSVLLRSSIHLHDMLFVMLGGGSTKDILHDPYAYVFNLSTKGWHRLAFDPMIPDQSSMTTCVTMDSKIILFGGKNRYSNVLIELTVDNVVRLKGLYNLGGFSTALYRQLGDKKFACDIDILTN